MRTEVRITQCGAQAAFGFKLECGVVEEYPQRAAARNAMGARGAGTKGAWGGGRIAEARLRV
jgi:hypothetical protein